FGKTGTIQDQVLCECVTENWNWNMKRKTNNTAAAAHSDIIIVAGQVLCECVTENWNWNMCLCLWLKHVAETKTYVCVCKAVNELKIGKLMGLVVCSNEQADCQLKQNRIGIFTRMIEPTITTDT
ncbi:hypothetical protein ACJX0J_017233, partial [Zea mays]